MIRSSDIRFTNVWLKKMKNNSKVPLTKIDIILKETETKKLDQSEFIIRA